MAWFDFFSSGVNETVSALGKAIDDNVTSDEERLTLKNEAEKIMGNLTAVIESNVSDRHKNDMSSDSWLSKNIRPLSLAFLTLSTVLLAYLTIFILEPSQAVIIDKWTDLLTVLLVTVYGFYFGSRGMEKVNKIRLLKGIK